MFCGSYVSGTAFFVSPTHLLTAGHVLAEYYLDKEAMVAVVVEDDYKTCRVLAHQDIPDVAILECVDYVCPNEYVLPLLASKFKEGIDLLIVGYPRELGEVFSDNHNTINRVEKVLNDYGIRFCVVPKIERASIDGYSFFIKGKPAIVVTMRYNRIDNFAFAVLHEVGHLKLHSSKDYRDNINLAYAEEELNTKEEQEANDFAAKALIPDDLWNNAPSVPLNPVVIQRDYSKWAKDMHLNKWIVLGRISYLTGIYMFKSDKTREIN